METEEPRDMTKCQNMLKLTWKEEMKWNDSGCDEM